ncbi:hypothetical protein H5410_048828 [Solanum commersonii]|uniref:S-protein homolog n=1 Tax=Solanum commersonii TaxID=4109 RepID=A0A9J5XKV8_SOLCO|nr:hypothetical protein H5410_048828 [Solanum commersonii]
MPYNIQSYDCQVPFLPKYSVHVLNNLPPDFTDSLQIHCASGDDDLGHKILKVGDDFRWGFCAWTWTLYFCHFWWDNKNLMFDVFNDQHYCVHDGVNIVPKDTTECIWQVKYDGIYLGYFDGDKINSQKYRGW